MLLMMLAGWINKEQQHLIEYLKEENKILREKLGRKLLNTRIWYYIAVSLWAEIC